MKNHILFSIPKPFVDPHISTIQYNAIKSWSIINGSENVVLMGKDAGVAEVSKELGVCYISDIMTTKYGTPLLSDAFNLIHKNFDSNFYTYINCDILLLEDFNLSLEKVSKYFDEFLMIGCRWNLDLKSRVDFNGDWSEKLKSLALKEGTIKNTTWTDYFTYSKNFWKNPIPNFALGRTIFDVWLLTEALLNYQNVVDVTDSNVVIHQNHDYNSTKKGKSENWFGEEALQNHKEAGKYYYFGNIDYSFYKLNANGLVENHTEKGFKNKQDFQTYNIIEAASNLIKNAKYDKAVELFEYLNCNNISSINLLYSEAVAELNQGNLNNAIDLLKKEIALYPSNDNASLLLESILKIPIQQFDLTAIIICRHNADNLSGIISALKKQNCSDLIVLKDKRVRFSTDEKIKIFDFDQTSEAQVRNYAIKIARGNYLAWIDADLLDISSDYVQKIKNLTNIYREVMAFYSNIVLENNIGEKIGFYHSRDYFYESDKMLYYHLVSNQILCDSIIVNRQLYDKIVFDENNRDAIDYKFWIDFFSDDNKVKLIPFEILKAKTDEYIDLSTYNYLKNNDDTVKNILNLIENNRISNIFRHYDWSVVSSDTIGEIAVFLLNRLDSFKLHKAIISIVKQLAFQLKSNDIYMIIIKYLNDNKDYLQAALICNEAGKICAEKTDFEKLFSYFDSLKDKSQNIFEKSHHLDREIKIKI